MIRRRFDGNFSEKNPKEKHYLSPRFLAGLPLQRRGANGLTDAVGHFLHVITQVGRNLPDLQAVERRRGRYPVHHSVSGAAAHAVNYNAGHGTGDAAAPALQQLPVLLRQRAQPLLVGRRQRGRRLLVLTFGGGQETGVVLQREAASLDVMKIWGLLGVSPVLHASHGRGAVVDADAGAVGSRVAPPHRFCVNMRCERAAV